MKNISRRFILKTGLLASFGTLIGLGGLTKETMADQALDLHGQEPISPFPKKGSGVSETLVNGALHITDQKEYLELNEVGALIWQQIDGSKSTYHLAEIVAKKYNIPFDKSCGDTNDFIIALAKKEFVTLPKSGPCYQLPG